MKSHDVIQTAEELEQVIEESLEQAEASIEEALVRAEKSIEEAVMSDDKSEKKERVLHTRVSTSLDEEIRQRANKLGVSVSNLVRNVLLNAFEMVEDIVTDTSRVAKAAGGHPVASKVADAAEVARPVGWQELVLNVNAICSGCNDILPRGSNAAMAVFRGSGPDTFLCPSCLKTLDQPQGKSDNDG